MVHNLNPFYFRIKHICRMYLVTRILEARFANADVRKNNMYGRNETTEFDKLDLVRLKCTECIEFRMTHMMKIYNTEK